MNKRLSVHGINPDTKIQPRLSKKQVLGLILRFEQDDSLTPQQAEQIVREVFILNPAKRM